MTKRKKKSKRVRQGAGGGSGGPSPAWLRMVEKARRSRQDADRPSTAQREGDSSPERQGVSSGGRPSRPMVLMVTGGETYTAHLALKCPGCTTPQFIYTNGWPDPASCRVLVTENVECRATVSAAEGRHHWSCTYWQHYPEEIPF
jgi:hypothetical protein